MSPLITFLLCALQATTTLAANLTIPVGSGTISAAVAGASPGDTLVLQRGTYTETRTITITKPLNIVGRADNTSVIAVDADRVPYVISVQSDAAEWNVSLVQIFIRNTRTGNECNITEPYALNVAAPMDVYNATLLAGFVNIEADMGPWSSTRNMQEVRVGTCAYRSANRTTLQGAVFSLHSATCHGRLAFRVAFDRLRSCGAEVDRTNPQFVAYKVALDSKWTETVTYDAKGKKLLRKAHREATAATIMRVQLDRVGRVNATIAVVHATPYQIQAVITAVTRQDDNTTDIDVALLLPFPFSIPVPASGSVAAIKTVVPVRGLTNWTMTSSACDRTPLRGACGQSLRFSMEGCQITGQYMLNGIWTQCQLHDYTGSPLNPNFCPPLPKDAIAISLNIDARDFCTSKSNVLGLFKATVNLWADANFTQKRTSTEFKLGQPVYASVDIKPGDSGIQVQNGQIVDMVRSNADNVTSGSNGTNCPTTTTNGTNLTQGFVSSAPAAGSSDMAQIQTAIGLTTSVACAAPASRHLSNTATVYTEKDEQGYFQTITLGGLNTFSAIINQTKSVTVCVAVAEIFTLPDFAGPSYVLTSLTGCTVYNLDGITGPATAIGSLVVTQPLAAKVKVAPALVSASSSGDFPVSNIVDGIRPMGECWSSGPAAYPAVALQMDSYYLVDHVLIYGPEADSLKIFVDGQACGDASGWPDTQDGGVLVVCPANLIGRTVKLVSFSPDTDLSLCEVEVWGQKMPSYVPPAGVPTDISIPTDVPSTPVDTNTSTDTAAPTATDKPTVLAPVSSDTIATNKDTTTAQVTTKQDTTSTSLSNEMAQATNSPTLLAPVVSDTIATNKDTTRAQVATKQDTASTSLSDEMMQATNAPTLLAPVVSDTTNKDTTAGEAATNQNAANNLLSNEMAQATDQAVQNNTNTNTALRRRATVAPSNKGKSTTGLAKDGRVVSAIQFEFKIQVDYVDRKGAARRRRHTFTARAASESASAQSPPLSIAYDNVEFNTQKQWEAVNPEPIQETQDDGLVMVAAGVSGVLLFLGCGVCTGIMATMYVRLGRLRRKVTMESRLVGFSATGGLAQSSSDIKCSHLSRTSSTSSTAKLLSMNGERRESNESHVSISGYRNSISVSSVGSDSSLHGSRRGSDNNRLVSTWSNSNLAEVGRRNSLEKLYGGQVQNMEKAVGRRNSLEKLYGGQVQNMENALAGRMQGNGNGLGRKGSNVSLISMPSV